MNQGNNKSKAKRNYYVDIIAFVPFLLLLMSGIVMLKYHSGTPYEVENMGLSGDSWIKIHKILAVISLPIVILHLVLHLNWFKTLFTFKLKNRHRGINITLFIFFLLCASTSLFSWLIFTDSDAGKLLRGLHNKLGIILLIFFAIHVVVNFKWLKGMTMKLLKD